MLPPKLSKSPKKEKRLRCPAHLKFVRSHHCSVPGCRQIPIEAAHVRKGLPDGEQGGMGLKPGDNWGISLCNSHHAEQHRIGETPFENKYHIDLREIAQAFAAASPHKAKFK